MKEEGCNGLVKKYNNSKESERVLWLAHAALEPKHNDIPFAVAYSLGQQCTG
jgi:hypothetical protein